MYVRDEFDKIIYISHKCVDKFLNIGVEYYPHIINILWISAVVKIHIHILKHYNNIKEKMLLQWNSRLIHNTKRLSIKSIHKS